jgi:hypothetical protein
MIYSVHLREMECDGPSIGTLMRKYGLHGSGTQRASGASLTPYSPHFQISKLQKSRTNDQIRHHTSPSSKRPLSPI